MVQAISETTGVERRPFQVDPVDHRQAALVRTQLWRTPPRHTLAEDATLRLGFERVWTALLLGALVGVPLALLLGAILSMLLPSSTLLYVEMTSVFLIGWAVATLACLAAPHLRGQWEIALWLGAAALSALAGCYFAVPGAAPVATTDLTLSIVLAAIAWGLPEYLPAR